tara:strand:+ start:6505 stop:6933 length:429 start_codon:yes stop_codon:yes gene_type:complete
MPQTNEFETPLGVIQSFESRESATPSLVRSYDDKGRVYALLDEQDGNIAIDVERYTQTIPDIFREFIADGEGPVDFYAKWTISEGISKLTGVPILEKLKKQELYSFPLEQKFRINEEGIKFEGITCLFKEEELLISVIKRVT